MSLQGFPHLELQMEFGRKRKDCTRFSICATLYLVLRVAPGYNQVTMSFNPVSRIITLTVAKAEIEKNQPDKLEFIESKELVHFEEDWDIPDDIRRDLGEDAPSTIKEGKYPVLLNNGCYSFFIPV